jgi:hypothetical protein
MRPETLDDPVEEGSLFWTYRIGLVTAGTAMGTRSRALPKR